MKNLPESKSVLKNTLKALGSWCISITEFSILCIAERLNPTLSTTTLPELRLYDGMSEVQPEELRVSRHSNAILDPRHNALYDESGSLIVEAALTRGANRRRINAPEKIDVEKDKLPKISGAYFGGTIFDQHYGHFLTETTSRLWPLIYKECILPGTEEYPWVFRQTSFFIQAPKLKFLENRSLADVCDIPFDILTPKTPVIIGSAIVPEQANINSLFAHPKFRSVCQKIGYANTTTSNVSAWTGKKVYFSRRGLPYGLRQVIGERVLEKKLRNIGFTIVHPENLEVSEQRSIFDNAQIIVGTLGSAFHTLLLSSRDGINIVYLCDAVPPATYQVLDALCKTRPTYVNCIVKSTASRFGSQHRVLDVDKALHAVDTAVKIATA